MTESSAVLLPTGPGLPAVVNLSELVSRHAAERPDDVALGQPAPARRGLTWAGLDEQVGRVAAGLALHGLVAGHRLALRGPPSVEYVIAYLAALRAGFVAVPLGHRSGPELVEHWLAETRPRLLLDAGPGSQRVPSLPLTREGIEAVAASAAGSVVPPADGEALAVLLYTSGTSEAPRAAMLSHRALLSQLGRPDVTNLPDARSVIALALPLSGVYALITVLGSWLAGAGRLVVADERADLAAVALAEGVTHLPLTPPMLARLVRGADLNEAFGSVRTVISGGARLPGRLAQEFADRTGLRLDQGYGLTETGPGVSTTLGGELLGSGHVGRALPGVDVRIGDGTDEGEPGEIAVRSSGLFSGYWPQATGGPGPDGWWPTGDLGYVQDGELFVLDRARDLLAVNGFHVYPAEVEQVIAELPAVREVAVIGGPGPGAGQRVVAFVVGGAAPDAVLEHCRARLAAFKRPAEVRRVERLPRTSAGLVRRAALREVLAAGS